MVDAGERRAGLALARTAIARARPGAGPYDPAALVRASDLPPLFDEPRGVFVTLERHPDGRLRGCIGYPLPRYPLGLAIARVAPSAAYDDPRFPPLGPDELGKVRIELSVLTVPEPIPAFDAAGRLAAVRVGTDGLIVERGPDAGLLLPQVATDQGWDAREFLDGVCEKAGLSVGAWREAETRLFRFQADVVGESAPGVVD